MNRTVKCKPGTQRSGVTGPTDKPIRSLHVVAIPACIGRNLKIAALIVVLCEKTGRMIVRFIVKPTLIAFGTPVFRELYDCLFNDLSLDLFQYLYDLRLVRTSEVQRNGLVCSTGTANGRFNQLGNRLL